VNNSWWWTEELSETCRVSFQNKFEKLVYLVGFTKRKFVTTQGHMNVQYLLFWHHLCCSFDFVKLLDDLKTMVARLLDSVIYSKDRKSLAVYHSTKCINVRSTGQRNVKQHNDVKRITVQLFHLLEISLFKQKQLATIKWCFSLNFLLKIWCMTVHVLRQLTERGFIIT
jgi:hypothetical protein